jgi:hypothetical protein
VRPSPGQLRRAGARQRLLSWWCRGWLAGHGHVVQQGHAGRPDLADAGLAGCRAGWLQAGRQRDAAGTAHPTSTAARPAGPSPAQPWSPLLPKPTPTPPHSIPGRSGGPRMIPASSLPSDSLHPLICPVAAAGWSCDAAMHAARSPFHPMVDRRGHCGTRPVPSGSLTTTGCCLALRGRSASALLPSAAVRGDHRGRPCCRRCP